MNLKNNNRGFTLIELLAVLVILSAIMGIAIPSISSSLERSNEKQNTSRKKVLEGAAELYVADYKNAIYKDLGTNTQCYIRLNTLTNKNYLSNDALKDANDKEFNGVIIFNKTANTFKYQSSSSGSQCCASNSSCTN